MAEAFEGEITFTPVRLGTPLPEGLKALLFNEQGDVDTILVAAYTSEKNAGDAEWTTVNTSEDSIVVQDDAERLVVIMYTNSEPEWSWLKAVSVAFPDVGIVLKGEEPENAYTVHCGLRRGKFRFMRIENNPDINNLNFRASLGMGFIGTWAGWMLDAHEHSGAASTAEFNTNIRRVLKHRLASSNLLTMMAYHLHLTQEQWELLERHRNYIPDLTPAIIAERTR